jgi:hypothetical protein
MRYNFVVVGVIDGPRFLKVQRHPPGLSPIHIRSIFSLLPSEVNEQEECDEGESQDTSKGCKSKDDSARSTAFSTLA